LGGGYIAVSLKYEVVAFPRDLEQSFRRGLNARKTGYCEREPIRDGVAVRVRRWLPSEL
jgi:hypothetical protein